MKLRIRAEKDAAELANVESAMKEAKAGKVSALRCKMRK